MIDLALPFYGVLAGATAAMSLWLDPSRVPLWERIVVAAAVGVAWPWVLVVAIRSGRRAA